ncbi:nephrin-like [Mizuhopecten yessoensis]|uniref:nephrin-like n=1 Tax=Mizuhopecten yessoensis TaxID=6573 RepID=UPI000B45F864|nr:nephrin-like [Mizuhopecten yessoensis]
MTLDRRLQCLLWLYITTVQGMTGLSVVVSISPTADVVSGQTLSITCQWSADYTGPNAVVNYKLNDCGGAIGSLFINVGTACPSVPPYTLTCNRATRTLGIQIPANSYSHGDIWTCEGRNDNYDNTTPPQTDTTTVDVVLPVTSVTITPSTTVLVDVGTSTTLTCTTQPHSRPTASVTWYRVVSGQPQQITSNINVSHDTQNSTQTTTSVLSYVPSKEDNGRTVYCVSDGGWTGSTDTTLESARVSINVRYSPDTDPVVSGYDGSTMYMGDSVTLSCTVVGGYPTASLSWTCPDGTTSVSGTVTVTFSNIFHGKTCSCVATHIAGGYSRTVTTPIFIVNIPVTTVIITPSTTVTVDVGTSTTLTCTTHPHSRPTANVTWYRVVSGQPQQITGKISVSYDTHESAQTTTSVLSYVPSKAEHGRTVYCVSDGGRTGSTTTSLQSNTVTLNVRYRPAISIAPLGDPYVITEGISGISLVCTVTSANPSVTSIFWTREVTEVSNTGVYNLPTITPGHSGEYTCSAINDVGTTTESITLVVISSPAEPNIVGITNVSSSSLTVQWSSDEKSSAPSTFNISHRCKHCDLPDSTSIGRTTNEDVYSTTFTNLLPETVYYVNITAINQGGSSSPLDLIVSTTPDSNVLY